MARFKTYKIDKTPIDSLPEMVTISKKVKGELFEKKFINIDKAKAWIEFGAANKLIARGAKKVKGELSSIGLISDRAW